MMGTRLLDVVFIMITMELIYNVHGFLYTSTSIVPSKTSTGTDNYMYTTNQPSDSTSNLNNQITYLPSITVDILSYLSTEESTELISSTMPDVIVIETHFTILADERKSSIVISSSMTSNILFSSLLSNSNPETPSYSLKSETELSLHTTFYLSTSVIDFDSDSSKISVTPSIHMVSRFETTTTYRDITSIVPSPTQTITEVITMCSCNSEESHFQSDSDIISSTSDQPCYTTTIHPPTCKSNVQSTSVFETTSVEYKPCSCPLQPGLCNYNVL